MTDRRAVRSEGPDPTRERVIEVFGRGGALAGAVAGFVPWAASGMSTFLRWVSPRLR